MATVASAVAAAAAAASTMVDVPESQRLIALSLGKIAASRGQKGGINLHKNLLVATVLTKARAAYMIQHMNAARQRAAHVAAASSPLSSSPSSSPCVEMKEQKAEESQSAPSASTTTATSTSATSSPSSVANPSSSPHHSSSSTLTAPQSVTPSTQETPAASSVHEGAAGTCPMQVAESEDKENTPPPPPPSSCRDASCAPHSQDCEKRLQGDGDSVKEHSKPALSSRPVVSHQQTGQQHTATAATSSTATRDVSRPSNTCCLLKRRRAMDRDHAENVSAPKVRIVETRVSLDGTSPTTTTQEPMQCDSPQISNLVNIFNTSFSGLSGAASGQSVLVSAGQHHSVSDNSLSYCAKEMKVGLDSVHHPSLVLSV